MIEGFKKRIEVPQTEEEKEGNQDQLRHGVKFSLLPDERERIVQNARKDGKNPAEALKIAEERAAQATARLAEERAARAAMSQGDQKAA